MSLYDNSLTFIESGAFSDLTSLSSLDIFYSNLPELNLSGSGLNNLRNIYVSGVRSLILDDVNINQTALNEICSKMVGITDASLFGADLGNITNIDCLLDMSSLELLAVDRDLYLAWQADPDNWSGTLVIPVPGDAEKDGDVDIFDFLMFKANYGS